MRDIALILHVVAGVVAIVFGPLAIVLTLRRHGLNWAGEVYHWAIALVCVSALVMVPYDWSQRAAEAPGGLWYRGVLRGYGGGWIALWTAIVVVSLPHQPWSWAIPIVLGSAVIEWLCFKPSPSWTHEPQPGNGVS